VSKAPTVEHKYHPKKDELDVKIKHYSLGKKADREDVILKIFGGA
jgi:hypothetical protein